jgi:ABC-type branched-subunit amino acid transport system substrate-binding protein
MNKLSFAATLLAALPCLALADGRIVIGQSAPLTGANAEIGIDIRDGALAWFKRVNASGGVVGKTIEFVTLDDKNDRKIAGANAVKLVNESGAAALFGFASATLSLDAMPIVNEKKVPFFAPFTGADAIKKMGPYVFTIRASYADELERILDHWSHLGIDRVTVLHYDDEIGNQNYATVERYMKAAGKVAVSVKIKRNVDIGKDTVDAIIKSDPQVVVVTTLYTPTAQLAKALRAANKMYSMTTLSFTGPSQLAKIGGADVEGISIAGVVPAPAKATVPAVRECSEAIKAAGVKELNYTNLEACIAARILVEGIRRGGKDGSRESIYKGLQALGSYDAGGYVVRFSDSERHGSKFVDLAVIGKGGVFRF